MVKNFAVATSHVTILLGIFAFVIGVESLDVNGIDYANSDSTLNPPNKKNCPNYADQLLCRYWNYLQESAKGRPWVAHENGTADQIEIPNEDPRLVFDIPVADNNFEKRMMNVFRRQNFLTHGYKRGPGFRSWGGKRDPTYGSWDSDKRSKFGAWGGKRNLESWEDPGTTTWNEESNEKRTRFANWGGKRNEYDKRSKFQSWGGRKRDYDGSVQDGAKRDLEKAVAYDQAQKRDSNWNYRTLYLREPFKKHFPKRPQFQSWGGKRTSPPWKNLLELYRHQPLRHYTGNTWTEEVKRKFSSWGGKRNDDDDDKKQTELDSGNWNESDQDEDDYNPFGNEPPSSTHLTNGKFGAREKRGIEKPDMNTYELPSGSKSSRR